MVFTNEKPEEACGVFGIVAPGRDVSRLTFYALFALQHRGQESAGIAVSEEGRLTAFKDMGLVSQVFKEETLKTLSGQAAIGHVRYSTTGSTRWDNAQPVCHNRNGHTLALGHNGNLI
ncbi:MAG TPA: amidophosphoribosyltransferase, partial [Actinobacteria bacterium]|nr:amidophosphoribosyltransferase [Actinomycetota bacterium]